MPGRSSQSRQPILTGTAPATNHNRHAPGEVVQKEKLGSGLHTLNAYTTYGGSTMVWKITISALAALAVSSSLAIVPALADVRDCSTAVPQAVMGAAQARSRRYGPFATIRRANEVANYFRRRGYNARVIYGGTLDSRVYYVDVW
jgi:hypothetical protein